METSAAGAGTRIARGAAGIAAAALLALAASAQARRADPAPGDPSAERLEALARELARDRGSPRGIALLGEIAELADEAPGLARIATIYAHAADDGGANPEVRALARFRLAELERRRGRLNKGSAHLARLGFVTAWRIVGPFDDEGRRGLATAYPPEQGIDLAARMPGKVREVRWRELPPEAVSGGFVDVGAALRPASEAVAYALAAIDSPRDVRVQLWFGASGASRVFVNGAPAISDAGYHPARLDQRGAWVSLRRGTNRVLVKLCNGKGRMGFYLRLADARGEGKELHAGDPAAAPPRPGERPSPIESAVSQLERRAARARGREEAAARLDLARALRTREADDAAEGKAAAAARRAADLAPGSVEAHLLAARLEDDHGRRRAMIDAAVAAAPGDPRALFALASDEIDQGRPQKAVRLLDRAIAAAPGWPAARVARVEALERAGLEARSALAAAEVARDFPTVPDAIRAASRAARRLGRSSEACERLRTLLSLRFDDAEARGSLAQALLARGDAMGAAEAMREGLRLDPSDVQHRLRLGQLLASNGRADEAEEAFAAAVRIAPEEADAFERRGRARLLAGRTADAKADLERALELRPQSPELKEIVRSLEPARERFERPYVLDAAALARSAPAGEKDEDAVILGDLKVTRVFPSGLSATYEQRVVKVLTARGADAFRRQDVTWTPDRQEVRVERARVLKPDGTPVDTHDESERSASEPWYRLYYDTRARTLTFPSLAPGDVLEVAWRTEDVAGENLLSDYFGDISLVEEGTRKLGFDWVILAPETRPLHANSPPGVARTERKLGGGVVEHRFAARNVPRIAPEPSMPGWSEVGRFVHVSTYGSWDEVARFYWDLVKEQLKPTDDVRRTAVRIAQEALGRRKGGGGAAGAARGRSARKNGSAGTGASFVPPPGGLDAAAKRAVVAAIYDFVVSQTRYVGLEFGIHGYKPYRVDDVLRRRFGDCKDKASLMHSLLEAVGIDSRLVLLRMRRLGALPEAPASLAAFNHAILYVPDLDLWLDGTASYSGSRELPDEDRGASVLVVNPGASPRFGTIPEASPGENRTEASFEIALSPDGSASVRGRSHVTGTQAPRYRRSYLSEHERRAQFEKAFNRTFPGLRVDSMSVSDPTSIEDDVKLEFVLSVPRYAQPDGQALRFTPFGGGDGYVEAYASQSERQHDMVLGAPQENVFSYRYALPRGWTAELPDPASADTPEGAFEVRYRTEGGAVVVDGKVVIKTPRIPAARYAAFRDLASRIDAAFARRVRISPPAAGEVRR